ncbi:ABC transporter substrate-binding protein [Robbsia andropogonis]|uniref:ABC transporter substrate-binding protein n=1 Tax=Robbsia andropogonis TaxID=28092 RepID=UPI003D1C4365
MEKFDIDARRRSLLLATLASGVMLPLDFARAQQPSAGDVLNIAYISDVPGWDPTAVTVPQAQSIYTTVFDSPLRYSPKLVLQPRQIKSWKWQDKNAQRLEVELRDDILFHDGSKLTTADLKYSLHDRPAQDKKLAVGGMFNTLQDVEIISSTRAVMVYNRPTPTAPIYFAFLAGYIIPKAYIEKVGAEAFQAKPVGAGPYRVVGYERGSRIVLEAFDRYWGGAPAIKNVTIQITPDPTARVAAIESGRASVAVQIPLRETMRLSKMPGITTKIYPYSEIYMLRMPNYVKPFDDINVRQAMHYAIDTQALSKAFYGGVARPVSVVAVPGSPADVPGFTFPYDPKKAIEARAKSGYGPSKPVKVPFLTTNGTFPSDYDVARAIVGMWQKVGIEAELTQTTMAQVIGQIQATKMPGVLLYSWANATGDPENYTGRLLDPRLRFSAWKDPALGPRIDALMTETDEAKRMQGYRDLNKQSSEETWVVPLLQAVTTIAYRSNVEVTVFDSGYILPVEYKRKG